MNLAKMTACMEPLGTLEIDGKPYTVRALSAMAMGRLQAIIDRKPDPRPWRKLKADYDELKAAGAMDPAVYAVEVAELVQDSHKWPPQIIYDGRANAMMSSDPDCLAEVIASSFRVTPEEARLLMDRVPLTIIIKIIQFSISDGSEDDDPKAGA